MRILKLFIAVILPMGFFSAAAFGGDNGLIPAHSQVPGSIVDVAASAGASAAFGDLTDAIGSGAVSAGEPDLAALRLSEAIPGGETFAPTVTLPPPVTVPEPGAIILAVAGFAVLLRRSPSARSFRASAR